MSRLQLRTPSFRSRLRLFFVVIVVVPMITMAVVLFQLIVASERSQTDARLAEAQKSLAGASGQNDRLVSTLKEARDQIGLKTSVTITGQGFRMSCARSIALWMRTNCSTWRLLRRP